jgi:hypothetical protein
VGVRQYKLEMAGGGGMAAWAVVWLYPPTCGLQKCFSSIPHMCLLPALHCLFCTADMVYHDLEMDVYNELIKY